MLSPKQRRNKQIIIATSFFLFWGLIGFGLSSLFVEGPTCSDGIQNQGEEGIDCGGPCKPCPPVLEMIKILKQAAIQADSQSLDLLAQIENPNQDFGVSTLSYQFEIFDQNNNLVKRVEGKTFIFPKQKKYIIESPVNLPSPTPSARVIFSIKSPINWEKLKDYEDIGLEIYERKYTPLAPGQAIFAEASGVLQNTSSYDYKTVEIVFILYDYQDRIINFQKTEQSSVYAGTRRFVKVFWRKPFWQKVKNLEVEAYTNLFLDETFMKRHGTEERFQQYQ